MNQQVETIDRAVNSPHAWYNLSLEYPNNLPETVSHMSGKDANKEPLIKEKLIGLYRTYVREWYNVSKSVSENMTYYMGNSNGMEAEKWHQMYLTK